MLEWTTEDWARWIEGPPLLVPPAPEPDVEVRSAGKPAPPLVQAERPEARAVQEVAAVPISQEEVGPEGDVTAAWSLALDEPEDEEDAEWWSSVARMTVAPAAPAPAHVVPAPVVPPPVVPAPVVPPPVVPPPVVPPPVVPPSTRRPAIAPPPPVRGAPAGAPERPIGTTDTVRAPASSASRRHSPARDESGTAVRVRAGLSLLGVSLLVGAVAAGLITLAIFVAAVVLRRALG